MPRIIGLTGGISTGKSTAARYLREHHHLPVFDADVYARQAVAVGSLGLSSIVNRYGEKILLVDGTLDRQQLGEIIFTQPTEKHWLESIVHPFVRECFAHDISHSTSPTLVAVIPLLFEAQLQNTVTEIWVVACTEAQQLSGLQERNKITATQAQARIDSQMPLADKIKLADIVLDNSGSAAALTRQIDQVLANPQPAQT